MAGSTSMEKLANALAESFMAKYPGVTVTAEFTGSGAGVEAVTGGSVDMEMLPEIWQRMKRQTVL